VPLSCSIVVARDSNGPPSQKCCLTGDIGDSIKGVFCVGELGGRWVFKSPGVRVAFLSASSINVALVKAGDGEKKGEISAGKLSSVYENVVGMIRDIRDVHVILKSCREGIVQMIRSTRGFLGKVVGKRYEVWVQGNKAVIYDRKELTDVRKDGREYETQRMDPLVRSNVTNVAWRCKIA